MTTSRYSTPYWPYGHRPRIELERQEARYRLLVELPAGDSEALAARVDSHLEEINVECDRPDERVRVDANNLWWDVRSLPMRPLALTIDEANPSALRSFKVLHRA